MLRSGVTPRIPRAVRFTKDTHIKLFFADATHAS
jgi:hypothetical protein